MPNEQAFPELACLGLPIAVELVAMGIVNFSAELAQLKRDTRVSMSHLFRGIENMPLLGEGDARNQLALADRKQNSWDLLEKTMENCMACSLHMGRRNIVYGGGNLQARLFLVLETPDADEDREARPAQAEAGELLDKMLLAIGFSRDRIFLTNVVKCRAPGDRKPEIAELDQCRGYLQKQIEIVAPEIILAMGEFASQTLSRTEAALVHLRGKWQEHAGIPTMPTWSPEQLLQNPALKREAWEDLKKVAAMLESTR